MEVRLRFLQCRCVGYVSRNSLFLNALDSVVLLELLCSVFFDPAETSQKMHSFRSEIRKVLVLDTKNEFFVINVAC